jgi:hypothetical protein
MAFFIIIGAGRGLVSGEAQGSGMKATLFKPDAPARTAFASGPGLSIFHMLSRPLAVLINNKPVLLTRYRQRVRIICCLLRQFPKESTGYMPG